MNNFKLTGRVTRIFTHHTATGELVKANIFNFWTNGKGARESCTLEVLFWDDLAVTFVDLVSIGHDISVEGNLKLTSYLDKRTSVRISQLQLHANKLDIISQNLDF